VSVLPEALREFWYAVHSRNPVFRRLPWGVVVADPRFPEVWDANHAAILEEAPDLTAEAIRSELTETLRQAGARHEHVEFWNPDEDSPALAQLRRSEGRRRPDVEMAYDASPPGSIVGDVKVAEIDDPDEAFLAWYRSARNEFDEPLSDQVLDQLLRRDVEVFLPMGLRWLVGYVDGEPAGYTGLLSASGVGYLDGVVTLPAYRRRGVASATVLAAVEASLASGDRVVHLLAERGGAPQRLYERLGFRVVSHVESFTQPLPPE
jgi:ribosomal protein S18 acetylase RimI-like enzyme